VMTAASEAVIRMSIAVSQLPLAYTSFALTQPGTLYTTGYAPSADRERLERLMHDHRRLLVDRRLHPWSWSRWYPNFRREALHQRDNLDELAHLQHAARRVCSVW
jgi:hypothetical protein